MFKIGETAMFIGPGPFSGQDCEILTNLITGPVRAAIGSKETITIDYYMIRFEGDKNEYAGQPKYLQKLPPHTEPGSWDSSVWKPKALTT